LFSTVFSRENFPFSAYFRLHAHMGLNFQTGMYEHTKVQLLLSLTLELREKIYLELQRCQYLRSSRYNTN